MSANLTSGRLLARNMLLNVGGGLLPAAAVLVAVPILVRALGDARFGILTLAWTVVGYFSLFDLGVGRAITHAVASRLGRGDGEDLGEIVWTALAVVAPVAVLAGAMMWLGAPWLTQRLLSMPPSLEGEAAQAFRLLAIAVPATALTAVLRGTLEGMQKFGLVNAVRAPYGVITYLGPVAVLPFSRSVVPAVLILTVARVVLTLVQFAMCARVVPGFRAPRVHRGLVRSLLGFGGWMTLSNVISPLMNTADRFVVGAVLTVSVVTHYATPHELVTKMWLFTGAVLPVFFPAFATSAAIDRRRTALLFDRCLRLTFAGLLLPTLLLLVLAPDILRLWIGPTFSRESVPVLQVLALAVFVNTIGQGGLTLLQSLGRPDLTGKFHLAELPVYVALMWVLLPRYGILGVAIAWAVRAIADAALLLGASRRVLPEAGAAIDRTAWWLGAVTGAAVLAGWAATSTYRGVIAAVAGLAWAAVVWWWILTPAERRAPVQALRPALPGD